MYAKHEFKNLKARTPVLNIDSAAYKRILGFHMTSRPPCWCPKQRKGGHVGAPTKSSGNLTLLLCKRFLLFSLKNMTVDHVSENQQLHSLIAPDVTAAISVERTVAKSLLGI